MITKFQGPEFIMHRYEGNPIFSKRDFPIPVKQVFNCGQTTFEGKTLLLIPAVYDNPELKWWKNTGIHVATSEDGIHFDVNPEPLFTSDLLKEEEKTVEINGKKTLVCFDSHVIDPRVTKIDDTYYICRPAGVYVAGEVGPVAALYKTKDFKTAEFVECISLPANRVPCLFPEKINGEYVRIDRPYSVCHVDKNAGGHNLDDTMVNGMWISYSKDLVYWGKHRPLLYPPMEYANYKLGPTPPIKTKDGWLTIIHGVYKENREWCYTLSAMLLDLENPEKVIGVLDKPILVPQEDYELYGTADNVVFACGAIADEEKDEIRIYYGAADCCIGLATGCLSELIEAVKNSDAGIHN